MFLDPQLCSRLAFLALHTNTWKTATAVALSATTTATAIASVAVVTAAA